MNLFNKALNRVNAVLTGIVFLTLSAVITGCSENDENGLYAADGSNIIIEISASGFQNGLLEIGSAQSATIFTVTSTTRWTIEVTDCEGAWCQITYGKGLSDAAGHIGDGSFTIDAAPNRSNEYRECNVTVYAIDRYGIHIPGKSIEIHLVQDRQSILVDYTGYMISPFGTSDFTNPAVTVTANQAWGVSSSHSWVQIIPGAGMEGDGFAPPAGTAEEKTITFNLKVDANPGTSTRIAEVTLYSPSKAFIPIRLNVTQEGSSETFIVIPSEMPQVTFERDTLELQVYSPHESWSVSAISAGSWVTLDRTSGEPSTEPVRIQAIVDKNESGVSRQASLVFNRSGNMAEVVVRINQNANPDAPEPNSMPQVSQPWIESGWTATSARILAYFSSPSIRVTRAGVYYERVPGPEDEENREEDEGKVYGVIYEYNMTGTRLNNLRPNTRYKVWAFVEYTVDGRTMESEGSSMYFTTPDVDGQPGTTPGIGDNTPPSPNN